MERKLAYPIVIKDVGNVYYVQIPDFDIGTQGNSIADAMEMARDAIGIMGIDMEDEGKDIPLPYTAKVVSEDGDIVTLVDIDFYDYRKKVDNKAVKKNCTIPYWISVEAEKANVNYSRLLQEAIINSLGLSRPGT